MAVITAWSATRQIEFMRSAPLDLLYPDLFQTRPRTNFEIEVDAILARAASEPARPRRRPWARRAKATRRAAALKQRIARPHETQ